MNLRGGHLIPFLKTDIAAHDAQPNRLCYGFPEGFMGLKSIDTGEIVAEN